MREKFQPVNDFKRKLIKFHKRLEFVLLFSMSFTKITFTSNLFKENCNFNLLIKVCKCIQRLVILFRIIGI